MEDNKQGSDARSHREDESQNAAQAGKAAVEASKVNEKDKPAEQRQKDEAKDAEQWRNEG